MVKRSLDERTRRFRDEVEVVVLKYAGGVTNTDWVLHSRQLYNWGMTYSQGDIAKKDALKTRLMKKTGGTCEDCRKEFAREELQMHRVDVQHNLDLSKNCGYFDENIALLCAKCHHAREKTRGHEEQCAALNE